MAANAPLAAEWSLEVARHAMDYDEREPWRQAQDVIGRMYAIENARERPCAIVERRAPQWKGR